MSLSRVILALCCFVEFTLIPVAHAEEILIYIRDDVYDDYRDFVGERDVTTINDFSGKTVRRDVVDMIIAQQALALGGFAHTFSYFPGKVNFRNTKMLQSGKLLISFDSYWRQDATPLNSELYISEPVIRSGEYIAGIYTSPQNSKTLSIKSLADLSALTAVSTPKWRTDWQTLQSLPLKELVREDEWLSMARMVNLQWIDFLLMPFHSSNNQVFSMEKITLAPVPKIAVQLNDSRHFVISKKHPKGAEAIKAINIGLQQLRKNKRIVNAYTQAGFFIDRNTVSIIN